MLKKQESAVKRAVDTVTSLDRVKDHRTQLLKAVRSQTGQILIQPFLPDQAEPLLKDSYTRVLSYLDKRNDIGVLEANLKAKAALEKFVSVFESHDTYYSLSELARHAGLDSVSPSKPCRPLNPFPPRHVKTLSHCQPRQLLDLIPNARALILDSGTHLMKREHLIGGVLNLRPLPEECFNRVVQRQLIQAPLVQADPVDRPRMIVQASPKAQLAVLHDGSPSRYWSTIRDSNPEPLRCRRSNLPVELIARTLEPRTVVTAHHQAKPAPLSHTFRPRGLHTQPAHQIGLPSDQPPFRP